MAEMHQKQLPDRRCMAGSGETDLILAKWKTPTRIDLRCSATSSMEKTNRVKPREGWPEFSPSSCKKQDICDR